MVSHILRGTCNEATCPLHGRCHCGCGGTARISPTHHTKMGMTRGMPRVYLHGHWAKAHEQWWPHHGRLTRRGIPRGLVLSDLRLLVRLYGTQVAVSRALGYSENWVSMLLLGKIRWIPLYRALRIAELVRGRRTDLPEPETTRNTTTQRALRAKKAAA